MRIADAEGWFTTSDTVDLVGGSGVAQTLVPLGRTDARVKILGENVDLEEIASRIDADGGVVCTGNSGCKARSVACRCGRSRSGRWGSDPAPQEGGRTPTTGQPLHLNVLLSLRFGIGFLAQHCEKSNTISLGRNSSRLIILQSLIALCSVLNSLFVLLTN